MLPWSGQNIKIAIVGDIILDEYWDGEVTRISPEAPVPVHLVKKTLYSPGGSGNCARNIALAGGKACLFSVWGHDEARSILEKELKHPNIDLGGMLTVYDRPTIKKTRITSQRQQLVRVDWEKTHPLSQSDQEALLQKLEASKFDAILISDYGKGALDQQFLAKLFAYAHEHNIPSIVDPKGKDFSKYRGATVLTPNRKEALFALNREDSPSLIFETIGRELQQTYNLDNVLLTLGAQGMLWLGKPHEPSIYKKAHAKDVFDVSGAGDTVASILCLALGAKASVDVACELANLSAAIVVGKWGTQPVTEPELIAALRAEQERPSAAPFLSMDKKIVDQEEMASIAFQLRKKNQHIVFTNGCFDLLHSGHVDYLEKARNLGDVLVVGVNSDASITRLKGKTRPILNLASRMKILAALASVDYVVAFEEDTPLNLIEKVVPHSLIKAADWALDSIVGADFVRSQGGTVQNIPLIPGESTTSIIKRIIERHT